MKTYYQYHVSALDVQKGKRFIFNTGLYNSYDFNEALKFLNVMRKEGNEFYCSFQLIKVKIEVIEVTLF